MLRLIVLSAIFGVVFGAPKIQNVPTLDGRIVGGEDANIEDFPYQVSLLYYSSHICGGSIISSNYVVTAAHCTYGTTTTFLAIRAGSSLRNQGGIVVKVREVLQHPQYDDIIVDYDISVLRLDEELSFSASIGKVYLPEQDQEIIAGTDCVVTGWGTLAEGGAASTQLQSVVVQVISKDHCDAGYGQGIITSRMMCAGVSGGGKDACQGDSGGPLVIDGQLIGIVSWGYGCARPRYPGVYSNVPVLRSFITSSSGI